MLRWEELEYARRDGVEEGIEQGIEQGRIAGLIEGTDKLLIQLVCRKLKKNKSLEEIAEVLVDFACFFDIIKAGKDIDEREMLPVSIAIGQLAEYGDVCFGSRGKEEFS